MLVKSILLKKEADVVGALIEVLIASLCLHRGLVTMCTRGSVTDFCREL